MREWKSLVDGSVAGQYFRERERERERERAKSVEESGLMVCW